MKAELKVSAPAAAAPDPTLVELFAKSPVTAARSYEQNVDDLLADLDAAAMRTRTATTKGLSVVQEPQLPDKIVATGRNSPRKMTEAA